MASHSDYTEIKLLPMYALEVELDNGDSTSNTHEWIGLEAESNWTFEPMTQNERTGLPRTVGYRLRITAYIPYNKLETYPEWLQDCANKELLRVKLKLGGWGSEPGYANASVEINKAEDAHTVMDQGITIQTEKVEARMRLKVNVTGFYSKDILDATGNSVWFDQGFGW